MGLIEFKAWFDGYAEAIGGVPTPEQWQRIQDQVKKIAAVTVTNNDLYRRFAIQNQPNVYDPRLQVQNINQNGQSFNQTRELKAV